MLFTVCLISLVFATTAIAAETYTEKFVQSKTQKIVETEKSVREKDAAQKAKVEAKKEEVKTKQDEQKAKVGAKKQEVKIKQDEQKAKVKNKKQQAKELLK